MPSIPLHPTPSPPLTSPYPQPLPQLLHTPSGLAIIELQASIHLPRSADPDSPDADEPTPIGHFVFPPPDSGSTRVWLYIGKHQRMAGEIKKLPAPLGVLRRRERPDGGQAEGDGVEGEEVEIAEIVRYKVLFASRPEPVGREEQV
ncbi:Ctf8-domain-containing protein [Geopyxis carbonaria]|nr:Ctf8-domain-containing protein [Geopyxis carbonaria]